MYRSGTNSRTRPNATLLENKTVEEQCIQMLTVVDVGYGLPFFFYVLPIFFLIK